MQMMLQEFAMDKVIAPLWIFARACQILKEINAKLQESSQLVLESLQTIQVFAQIMETARKLMFANVCRDMKDRIAVVKSHLQNQSQLASELTRMQRMCVMDMVLAQLMTLAVVCQMFGTDYNVKFLYALENQLKIPQFVQEEAIARNQILVFVFLSSQAQIAMKRSLFHHHQLQLALELNKMQQMSVLHMVLAQLMIAAHVLLVGVDYNAKHHLVQEFQLQIQQFAQETEIAQL